MVEEKRPQLSRCRPNFKSYAQLKAPQQIPDFLRFMAAIRPALQQDNHRKIRRVRRGGGAQSRSQNTLNKR